MSVRVLLVHGAWHDAHAWDIVVRILHDEGSDLDIHAVNLPGKGRASGEHTLSGHADFLRTIIASSDEPTLLVAHSYGGAVATEALHGEVTVDRLLFVTAFALPAGYSCMRMNDSAEGSESDGDAFVIDGDYVLMPPEASMAAFYADLPPSEAARWAARTTPEHHDTVYSPVSQQSWRGIPHAYVVCRQDNGILPDLQRRMASTSERIYELDSGHSPMLSQPQGLAAIILEEAGRISDRFRRSRVE